MPGLEPTHERTRAAKVKLQNELLRRIGRRQLPYEALAEMHLKPHRLQMWLSKQNDDTNFRLRYYHARKVIADALAEEMIAIADQDLPAGEPYELSAELRRREQRIDARHKVAKLWAPPETRRGHDDTRLLQGVVVLPAIQNGHANQPPLAAVANLPALTSGTTRITQVK